MRRRKTEAQSAILRAARRCLPESKPSHGFVTDSSTSGQALIWSYSNHSYTWLNSRFEPRELPAHEYMTLAQRWISSKIDDASIFPTDASAVACADDPTVATNPLASQLASSDNWVGKRSGFPKDFVGICKTIFLQMFRVYAHLYWAHFTDPFYHLNLEKQLNSCFSHFILTATALDMLKPEDLEPIQLLIDLWAANDTFPVESKAYKYANLESGKALLQARPTA